MELDKTRILKLLELTTSSNDNEAFFAIRKANSILKDNKMSWHEFFKKKPVNEQPDVMYNIREILDYLLDCQLSRSQSTFITGLNKSYVKYGSLTEKQYNVLLSIFSDFGGKYDKK